MNDAASPPPRERAGGRVVVLVLLGLALLAGGAYAVAYAVAGDNVPRGTSVAGVDIGGRTEAEARTALERGLAGRTDTPFELAVGDITREVPAAELGLEVDYAASVADAGGGRSWRPQRLWDYFTGGRERPPALTLDQDRLASRLAALDQQVATPAVDGAVAFVDGGVQVSEPVPGSEIDTDAAAALLVDAYLGDEPAVTLPLRTVVPDIDETDVQQAVTSFANPAVAAPVTLVFGETSVRLQPRDFAGALSLVAQDGALVPQLDDAALSALVATATAGAGAPVDASITIRNGRPRVVKAKPGITYAPETITASFLEAVARPDGQRELAVEATVAEPEFTTAEARALQVKEQVSTFTTEYPYAEYRNVNIGRAAELVDGTLLMPGETFSLNDTTGERTRENGFTEGFVISNGIFANELGGGVSQMATTTFNAMYFAGLKDIEHKPHSFYISRYPVGREATVAFGAIDLRFQNDTPHGVLITASIDPATPGTTGSVTVSMWSTQVWDITSETGPRYNPTSPDTRTITSPECYPNTGYGGFDIDVTRFFRRAGQSELERQETFTTTYTPSDTVICRPPPPTD